MRPATKKSELPSHASVHVKITNEFIDFLAALKRDIAAAPGNISTLWDMWTVPHTSDPIMGMLLQWIEVRVDGGWVFRDEVGAFRKIFGKHDGGNLGRYFVGLLDRAGVTSRKHSKVRLDCFITFSAILTNHERHYASLAVGTHYERQCIKQ